MDKFIIQRQKFQGENKVSVDYVSLDSNNNICVEENPLAFGSYFGSKEQARNFRDGYMKHLQATADEEGVSYKMRVKVASQALRDFCTQSMALLDQKDTVTEETQAAVLETIKVEEPEKVEQPVEATVKEAKPKKAKKSKKAEAETEQTEAAA